VRKRSQRRPSTRLAAGASGIVLALAPIVNAQEGGLWATLDLSSRLSIDDNLQMETPSFGVTTSLDNVFAFELTSRTRTQSLTFSANGVARAAAYPGGTTLFALEDPGVSLSYSRGAATSAISARASYLLEDLSFVDWTETVSYSFDDFLEFGTGSYSDWIASLGSGDETSYLVSGGTRETLSFGATYEFGKDAPFGGSIGVTHSQVAYTDANPSLTDTATDRLTGTANFEITPTLSGSATLNLAQTTTGGGTNLSQSLRFGISQDFYNGLIGLSLNSDLSGTTKASVNRSLDWSTGSVSFDLGLAATPGGSGVTAGLGYRQDLKDGVLGASLSSDVSSSGVTSSARASYRYEINDVSRLSFAFNYSGNVPSGGGAGDQRAKISASYSRDITDDIYLNAGYSYDFLDASDADPAFSNGVFLGIGRTYSFRPW
jgi:hypothetical protein